MSPKSKLPELWELENGTQVRFLAGHPTRSNQVGTIVGSQDRGFIGPVWSETGPGVWIRFPDSEPTPYYAYSRVEVVSTAGSEADQTEWAKSLGIMRAYAKYAQLALRDEHESNFRYYVARLHEYAAKLKMEVDDM